MTTGRYVIDIAALDFDLDLDLDLVTGQVLQRAQGGGTAAEHPAPKQPLRRQTAGNSFKNEKLDTLLFSNIDIVTILLITDVIIKL